MKQLRNFSLILAVAAAFLFLLLFLLSLNLFSLIPFVTNLLLSLFYAACLAFFLSLSRASSSLSPQARTPALTIAIGCGVVLLSFVPGVLQSLLLNADDLDYDRYLNLYTSFISVGSVIFYVGCFLVALGVFRLAPCFKKGSIQEIASFTLAFCLIASISLDVTVWSAHSMLFELIGEENILTFYTFIGIITPPLLVYAPLAFFFYAFSLSPNQRENAPGPMQTGL